MARRGSSDADLQGSVDRLADAFDRLATRIEGLESRTPSNGVVAGAGETDRLLLHVRRYMPFYALATIWVLMIALLPTQQADDEVTSVAGATSAPTTTTLGSVGTTTSANTGPAVPSSQQAPEVSGDDTAAPTTPDTPNAPAPPAEEVTGPFASYYAFLGAAPGGQTRAGLECAADVRQVPWSAYAAPCLPAQPDSNPGATYRGVDAEKIRIVRRTFPESANSQAVDAFTESAGFASDEVVDQIRAKFVEYFNQVFELWGRQVELVEYESQFGNSTEEAQSRGKEGACADADLIVNELKAFAVVGGSDVFGECAAERSLVVFNAGPYFPETYYKQHHPFLWNDITECERISYQVAEYIGKRLAGKPAKHAKNLEKGLPRKFGTYVPNNDGYQHCVNITETAVKRDYGVDPGSRYNYTLDVSRFPDEAARGAVQFKADGVTTIVMACDPLSMVFLTQSSTTQNYFPEWFNIGVAGNDTDNFARLWDQQQVRGSLFGMSQLGSTDKVLGPSSEPAKTYKAATGTDIPEGTTGEYHDYLRIFSWLQATGPNLTPETMAEAVWSLPPGGPPRFEVGYISYLDGPDGTPGAKDHTGVDDSREIYWMADKQGPDGSNGTYVETYDGKRFRNGEWPKEDPPVYPGAG